MELESREKELANTLQALGNRIAAQKDQENGSVTSDESVKEPEKTIRLTPEQHRAWLERIRDGQHLRQDLTERTASGETLQQERARELEAAKAANDALGERIRTLQETLNALPEPDEENLVPSEIADYVRQIEGLRVEWMRLHALIEAEKSSAVENSNRQTTSGEKSAVPAEGGFRFFLPLILTIVLCTLFLSAALFIAWKVPL